jgi:hypothetical protein
MGVNGEQSAIGGVCYGSGFKRKKAGDGLFIPRRRVGDGLDDGEAVTGEIDADGRRWKTTVAVLDQRSGRPCDSNWSLK